MNRIKASPRVMQFHSSSTNVSLLSSRRYKHIEDLVQDCSKSSANALESLQSCTKPSLSLTMKAESCLDRNSTLLVAPEIVVMKTCGATSDDTGGTMTIPSSVHLHCFQGNQWRPMIWLYIFLNTHRPRRHSDSRLQPASVAVLACDVLGATTSSPHQRPVAKVSTGWPRDHCVNATFFQHQLHRQRAVCRRQEDFRRRARCGRCACGRWQGLNNTLFRGFGWKVISIEGLGSSQGVQEVGSRVDCKKIKLAELSYVKHAMKTAMAVAIIGGTPVNCPN